MSNINVSFNYKSDEDKETIKEFFKTHTDAPLIIMEKINEEDDDFFIQMIEFNIKEAKQIVKDIQDKIDFIEKK